MTNYIPDISLYLRGKYFEYSYMGFGHKKDDHTKLELRIDGKTYTIPNKLPGMHQYEEMLQYVESEYKRRYPEIFL